MKNYRVRKTYSNGKKQPNYVYHADLLAENRNAAIKKARRNECNWRWIDTFDLCDKKYTQYEAWILHGK